MTPKTRQNIRTAISFLHCRRNVSPKRLIHF
jgi:hypothetical protein